MALDALTGRIEERELEKEMRSSYLDYAMSVIVGRALPDVRDGLKPVHRRVLYAMHDIGLQPTRAYRKCAFIVGEVMGKYHPHGDSAIYDTLVRMAQDFSLRYLLVDGQGNFGSIDDDPAAAMRYTEARLTRLATELLRDIDADTVDFGPNYDESTQEPLVLPARFPNLLVNGTSGIAVGMATNIPPHNLREVAGAVAAYIDDPEIDLAGLMEHVKGPDFPGGGIMSREGIRDAYASGRGSIKVRARAHVEPLKGGKEAIVVTELPFTVKKGGDGGLITKIADLVRDKKLEGISDLRDETDALRDAPGDRAQARRPAGQGRPQQPLQENRDADDLRRQHGGAGRRRAADAEPARADPPLRRPPARGRHPPHPVRTAPRRGPRPHPRGAAGRARQPRRGDQTDPRLERPRRRPRRPDRELRALARAGAGDPRHAPAAPDRARGRQSPGRARRPDGADRRAARDPRRRGQGDGHRQGGAGRNRRVLRRRAPHRTGPLRGRRRDRGHDRRPADGDLADRLRLRQAAAAGDLPPAAPRRRRGDGDEPQRRRLHRPPPHLLDPRLPALLHQPRQGLPAQGLRAAGGLAQRRKAAR